MTEHGFLFKAAMVNAILDDLKDQTRRILTARNSTVLGHEVSAQSALWKSLDWSRVRVDKGPHFLHPEASQYLHVGAPDDTWYRVRCRYSIGDRIWVRETYMPDPPNDGSWAYVGWQDEMRVCEVPDQFRTPAHVIYQASWKGHQMIGWKPSIHMPRWACRQVLEITDIRVQRVQDISGDDVIAEGLPVIKETVTVGRSAGRPDYDMYALRPGNHCEWEISPQVFFRKLWDSINAERGFAWKANPWVWAITFKRIES